MFPAASIPDGPSWMRGLFLDEQIAIANFDNYLRVVATDGTRERLLRRKTAPDATLHMPMASALNMGQPS